LFSQKLEENKERLKGKYANINEGET
jgi:hypothetical protein